LGIAKRASLTRRRSRRNKFNDLGVNDVELIGTLVESPMQSTRQKKGATPKGCLSILGRAKGKKPSLETWKGRKVGGAFSVKGGVVAERRRKIYLL